MKTKEKVKAVQVAIVVAVLQTILVRMLHAANHIRAGCLISTTSIARNTEVTHVTGEQNK
jgi:hypothetical protein